MPVLKQYGGRLLVSASAARQSNHRYGEKDGEPKHRPFHASVHSGSSCLERAPRVSGALPSASDHDK